MKQTIIVGTLIAILAATPAFAAKKKASRHHKTSVATFAKRQSHLAKELGAKASQVSQKATQKKNKKLLTQAGLLHRAAAEANAATHDLLQAAKYSKR